MSNPIQARRTHNTVFIIYRHVALVFFGFLLTLPANNLLAEDLDQQQIKEILQQHWTSLESLDLEADVFNMTSSGQKRIESGYSHYEYAITSDGKRTFNLTGVYPNRSEVFVDNRDNAKRMYRIFYLGKKDGVIERVNVAHSRSQEDGESMIPLMALMPLGKPL